MPRFLTVSSTHIPGKKKGLFRLSCGLRDSEIGVERGDDDLVVDRLKGLSFETSMVGEFMLSSLEED